LERHIFSAEDIIPCSTILEAVDRSELVEVYYFSQDPPCLALDVLGAVILGAISPSVLNDGVVMRLDNDLILFDREDQVGDVGTS
jgi:hypothetical protein